MATEAEVRLEKKINNLVAQVNVLASIVRGMRAYPSARSVARKTLANTTGDLLGTGNQVLVANGTDSLIKPTDVTLSLPQSIHTGATPEFEGLGLGTSTFGTNADKVLGMAIGTQPTSAPANMAQLYVADRNGVAGKASFHVISEDNVTPYTLVKLYGEMWHYENADLTPIDLANQYHGVIVKTTGLLKGWTYKIGSTGPIASFANYHATVPNTTLITDVAHGLLTGEIVAITNSTNYTGKFAITRVDADTFYIPVVYVAEAGGPNWVRGSSLRADPGSAGVYRVSWSATIFPVGANNNFKMETNLNTGDLDNMAASIRLTVAADRRNLSSSGLCTIADGDYIWLSIRNETDATDVTVRHINLNVHKIG